MILNLYEYKLEYKFKHKGQSPKDFQKKTGTYTDVVGPFHQTNGLKEDFEKWKKLQKEAIEKEFKEEEKKCK